MSFLLRYRYHVIDVDWDRLYSRTKMSEISAEISAIFRVSEAVEAKFETLSRSLEKSPKIGKYRRYIGVRAIFRWKFRSRGSQARDKFLRHFLGDISAIYRKYRRYIADIFDISVDISSGFLCG